MNRFQLLAILLLLLSAPIAYSESAVAINSLDGRDVLSGIFYANALGIPVHFMPVPASSVQVFAAKVGSGKDVLLIQSTDKPVSGFVESELAGKGNRVEVYPTTDGAKTNIELAKKSGAKSFIIVDSAYSDSAVSVLSYAALTKSYVILADKGNIADVKKAVEGGKVTIYGFVDQKVRDELAPMNPALIGDGADKYADNIKLAGMVMDTYGLNRPIMSDGGTLEDAVATGKMPILLSGRLVPQATYDFIKQRVGDGSLIGVMLIGNDYVAPIYDMRERMKNEFAAEGKNKTFGIMVKFAQAVPSAQAGAMTLDTFTLPAYKPSLNIVEVSYNKDSRKVMAGLENTGSGPLYFELELKVKLNGEDYKVFSQSTPKLIERGESAGLEYPLDVSGIDEGSLTAGALVRFGASGSSLDAFATKDGVLQSISYTDTSSVTVKTANYDKAKQLLKITLKNNGNSPAYALVKATLIDDDGVPTKISSSAIREIEPSSLYVEEFPLIMSEKEIGLNKEIPVSVDYGGRRGFLVKKAEFTLPLAQEAAAGGIEFVVLAAGVVLLLLLAFVAYKIATKKKQ